MKADRKAGARIKARRTELGLSQREIAGAGTSYAYISRVEAGERLPSLAALIELAKKLKTTALYLATGKQDVRCPLCGRFPGAEVLEYIEKNFNLGEEDRIALRLHLVNPKEALANGFLATSNLSRAIGLASSLEQGRDLSDAVRAVASEVVVLAISARDALHALSAALEVERTAREQAERERDEAWAAVNSEEDGYVRQRKLRLEAEARLQSAEDILRKAQAPRRPDGTYNYSREAFEQMANEYFANRDPR